MTESTTFITESDPQEQFWAWLRSKVSLSSDLIEALQGQAITYRAEQLGPARLVIEVVSEEENMAAYFEFRDKMSVKIEELDLRYPTLIVLRREGIRTVGDLVKLNAAQVRSFRNFSERSMPEIQAALAALGLILRP